MQAFTVYEKEAECLMRDKVWKDCHGRGVCTARGADQFYGGEGEAKRGGRLQGTRRVSCSGGSPVPSASQTPLRSLVELAPLTQARS